MSSNSTINDAELKYRLASYGISVPITSSTRKFLLMKLHKLEMDSSNIKTDQSVKCIASNSDESMDTSRNDLNEYEIREGMSKYGLKQVPLTDSTRPVISNILRKKK